MKRRHFLELVGRSGGAGAVFSAMRALDLQPPPDVTPYAPVGRAPAGTRVVILGAGLSGLTAAYELQKLGYACEVLEARGRPGGRAVTVRRGVASEETGPGAGQLSASTKACTSIPGRCVFQTRTV